MRLINALLGLVFVALGLLFTALNRAPVAVDFGLFTAEASLGFALLAALLAGALLGGVVAMLGGAWRRRSQAGRKTRPGSAAADHD